MNSIGRYNPVIRGAKPDQPLFAKDTVASSDVRMSDYGMFHLKDDAPSMLLVAVTAAHELAVAGKSGNVNMLHTLPSGETFQIPVQTFDEYASGGWAQGKYPIELSFNTYFDDPNHPGHMSAGELAGIIAESVPDYSDDPLEEGMPSKTEVLLMETGGFLPILFEHKWMYDIKYGPHLQRPEYGVHIPHGHYMCWPNGLPGQFKWDYPYANLLQEPTGAFNNLTLGYPALVRNHISNTTDYLYWDSLEITHINPDPEDCRIHLFDSDVGLGERDRECWTMLLRRAAAGLDDDVSWFSNSDMNDGFNYENITIDWNGSVDGTGFVQAMNSATLFDESEEGGVLGGLASSFSPAVCWLRKGSFLQPKSQSVLPMVLPVSHSATFYPGDLTLRREGILHSKEYRRDLADPFANNFHPDSTQFPATFWEMGIDTTNGGTGNSGLFYTYASDKFHFCDDHTSDSGFALLFPGASQIDFRLKTLDCVPDLGVTVGWASWNRKLTRFAFQNARSTTQGMWVVPASAGAHDDLDDANPGHKPLLRSIVYANEADSIAVVSTPNGHVTSQTVFALTQGDNVFFEGSSLFQPVGNVTEYYDWLAVPLDQTAMFSGAYTPNPNSGAWFIHKGLGLSGEQTVLRFEERGGAGTVHQGDLPLGYGPAGITVSELHGSFAEQSPIELKSGAFVAWTIPVADLPIGGFIIEEERQDSSQ